MDRSGDAGRKFRNHSKTNRSNNSSWTNIPIASPAGTSFSVMSGLNTPLNAIRIACGDECDFETIAYGQHLAKRYETYVLD